jgi:hypothetical protein
MKTGNDWFVFLSEEEQINYKENIYMQNLSFDFKMRNYYRSLKEFIYQAFLLDVTIQGFQYWDKISKRKIKL